MSATRGEGAQSLGAWFLGPRGESHDLLWSLVHHAMHHSVKGRKTTYPSDPDWTNPDSADFRAESQFIQDNYEHLVKNLEKECVPFSSYRYQGHMLWDQTLPSLAGYFAALLYNQNNVAAEASPLTTALEMEVAADLCKMVGLTGEGRIKPWAHITCDGSVANIEAIWAARNTRLYPLALCAALRNESDLGALDSIEVRPTGRNQPLKRLAKLNWWELMNLTGDTILGLPTDLKQLATSLKMNLNLLKRIDAYTVQYLGLTAFAERVDEVLEAGGDLRRALAKQKVLGSASAHYSLPKATTLVGLGSRAFHQVKVQRNARLDTDHLQQCLENFLAERIPVMTVVSIIGTTEESAVDDLSAVLEMRQEFRERGMDFFIHADGAWGSYFSSLLHEPAADSAAGAHLSYHQDILANNNGSDGHSAAALAHQQLSHKDTSHRQFVHTDKTGLNAHTERQLRRLKDVDTITADPHKSGFAPYPAGSLLYRDARMPQMIQITAPVIYREGDAPTVGVFGVEGSKPGAAAAGVYFSHKIIPLDQGGYGRILGRCTFNTKRAFAQLVAMQSERFDFAVLTDLSDTDLDVVRSWVDLTNEELWEQLSEHPAEMDIFRRAGPDLNIITYALNPIINGERNTDPKVTNDFNDRVFRKLSIQKGGDPIPPLYVTSSIFDSANSGAPIAFLRKQLRVNHNRRLDMNFLITTVMNPWLSDTENGTRNMIPEVFGHLQRAAESVVDEMAASATSKLLMLTP